MAKPLALRENCVASREVKRPEGGESSSMEKAGSGCDDENERGAPEGIRGTGGRVAGTDGWEAEGLTGAACKTVCESQSGVAGGASRAKKFVDASNAESDEGEDRRAWGAIVVGVGVEEELEFESSWEP